MFDQTKVLQFINFSLELKEVVSKLGRSNRNFLHLQLIFAYLEAICYNA